MHIVQDHILSKQNKQAHRCTYKQARAWGRARGEVPSLARLRGRGTGDTAAPEKEQRIQPARAARWGWGGRVEESWGGLYRGGLGVVGPSCSLPRNKNANLANSPVDRLYGKQVRVPRSTCVPSIYQLAFSLF